MTEENNAVMVRQETGISLKAVTDRVNLVHQVLNKVMVQETHYGKVPGCGNKMVLLKPGADVLAMTFRLVPQFKIDRTDMENGHREYDVTCSMYSADGVLLGQGVGSASTMEKKYRYRWEGEGKDRHKIENEDIADCYNTVLKIAKKRAHIDATLTVTGAADLFTQDLIDDEEIAERAPIQEPKEKQKETEQKKETSLPALEHKGILKDVSEKQGKGKRGNWIRYGLEFEDGIIFGTFDCKIAEIAIPLIGNEVIVTYTEDDKVKTATSISPVIS